MGTFDDLLPQNNTGPGPRLPARGGGTFSDLVPAAPKKASPEDERMERLREVQRKIAGGEPGASDLFSNSYTLGLTKPVGGLASALGGEVGEWLGGEPASFGERYNAYTDVHNERMDKARENSGWAGTAADVGGSIFTGGPAKQVVNFGLKQAAKDAAILGGVEGAASAADRFSGSGALDSALGGLKGGTISGAATGLLGGLVDRAQRFSKGGKAERALEREIARGPDPNTIRNESRALFKQLDDAGIAYDTGQSTQLADDILTNLVQGKGGWDPDGAHAVLKGVVKRIEDLRGKPVSLATLQQIREQAGANATANEPSVRNAAGRIMSALDGYVGNIDPALSGLPAGERAGAIWKEARKKWRTANVVDDLNWRVDKAERRADSTNSGQNAENAIRQNIRGAVDKATQPGRFNPYSPEELAQMEKVVSGTPAQNWWRRGGNFVSGIPTGTVTGGLGAAAALTGLGGIDHATDFLLSGAAGLGATGAAQGAGHLLKSKAADMARDETDKLVRLIATGSLKAPQTLQRSTVPTRAQLARMMFGQSLMRGTGLAIGGG